MQRPSVVDRVAGLVPGKNITVIIGEKYFETAHKDSTSLPMPPSELETLSGEIAGHFSSTIAAISAVKSALENTNKALIETHIAAMLQNDKAISGIADLKEVFMYPVKPIFEPDGKVSGVLRIKPTKGKPK